MLFCLKNFIFKKWVFVLFYFLKGIGSALKPFSPLHSQLKSLPKKRGFKKKKGFKRNPLKREFHKEAKH